jgi:membrane fusion protein, heavy metal efflux system
MNLSVTKKQGIAIAITVIAGIALGALILNTNHSHEDEGEHEHDHAPAAAHDIPTNPNDPVRGPHRGKLFVKDGYGIELSIFEKDVEPEFRVYTYQDGKPIDPATTQVSRRYLTS